MPTSLIETVLEQKLAANPADFPTRLKLMAYHQRSDRAGRREDRAKRVQRALWLIEHHPGMRRFTRLTNGFSKKIENHEAAVALHYMHYNFARIHQTLRVTPAMEAGISDHVWTLEEIVNLLK